MPFDGKAFGRRVAAARAWAGLAPKQVADMLGISAEAIYRLERGQRQTPPRRGELLLLAEALGQPVEWLLEGERPPWQTTASDHGHAQTSTPLLGLQERLVAEVDRLSRLNDSLEARLDSEAPPRPKRKRPKQ